MKENLPEKVDKELENNPVQLHDQSPDQQVIKNLHKTHQEIIDNCRLIRSKYNKGETLTSANLSFLFKWGDLGKVPEAYRDAAKNLIIKGKTKSLSKLLDKTMEKIKFGDITMERDGEQVSIGDVIKKMNIPDDNR